MSCVRDSGNNMANTVASSSMVTENRTVDTPMTSAPSPQAIDPSKPVASPNVLYMEPAQPAAGPFVGRPYRRTWTISSSDGHATGFRATALRYGSGQLVLMLDSAANRHSDSIAIGGLRKGESLANMCRIGSGQYDDRIAGITRDTVHEQWSEPRFAWLLDNSSGKIKPVEASSISCMLEMPD